MRIDLGGQMCGGNGQPSARQIRQIEIERPGAAAGTLRRDADVRQIELEGGRARRRKVGPLPPDGRRGQIGITEIHGTRHVRQVDVE